MRRSRRSFGVEPLGAVLSRDSAVRVPPSVETSPIAFRDWEAAVGTRIAARALPVKLDRGVLLVRTATTTWAQELSLLADTIVAQLKARGIAVKQLRFRVGHVDAPARPPSRDEVRRAPPEVPLPPAITGPLERVADPELRDVIAHAAARNLGWQATLERTPEPPPAQATPASPAARNRRAAAPAAAPPARGAKPAPAGRRGRT